MVETKDTSWAYLKNLWVNHSTLSLFLHVLLKKKKSIRYTYIMNNVHIFRTKFQFYYVFIDETEYSCQYTKWHKK